MDIKAQAIWRPEKDKYKNFEIGFACENIIPPMPKAGIDIGAMNLITATDNYACKVSYIYDIKNDKYLMGDEEITFAKDVLNGLHEHYGETIEESIEKAGKEVEEWIDKNTE